MNINICLIKLTQMELFSNSQILINYVKGNLIVSLNVTYSFVLMPATLLIPNWVLIILYALGFLYIMLGITLLNDALME